MSRPSHLTRTPPQDELISNVLHDLTVGKAVDLPAVAVTAHPYDETLGMGGRLGKFKCLTLLQLTDGAPLWESDAKQLGFATRTAYAAAREIEAQRAIATLGLDCRRIRFGAPDQASVFFAPELLGLLERELCGAALVFTHPYEGGHPDHDLAALVVQCACDRICSTGGTAPARLEFASYHHRAGRMVAGQFWPDPDCPEAVVALEGEAAAAKGPRAGGIPNAAIGDPMVVAADTSVAFGKFADLCGSEPLNSGIRGLGPALDFEAALAHVLRINPTRLEAELDEQGLQIAALGCRGTSFVVDAADVTICSPFYPHNPELGRAGAHFVGLNTRVLPWLYFGRPATEVRLAHWMKLRAELYDRVDLAVPAERAALT